MSDGHGHDDWFRHSTDEALPQAEHAEHVSTKALGITLLLIVFGVLFTILIITGYFTSYTNQIRAERQESTRSAASYMSYRQGVDRKLEQTGWIDREAGVLYIPLDRAIDAVVEEYSVAAAVGEPRLSDEGASGIASADD